MARLRGHHRQQCRPLHQHAGPVRRLLHQLPWAVSYGQPNYLALFSGSDQGVADNGTYTFTGPNLERSLVARGLSFVGYSESLPSAGYTSAVSGAYQRWHNPWVDFTNVPAAVNQPFSSFPTDYRQLPTVSFVIPNFNNDMHDGSVAAGDSWLQSQLGAYVQWASSHNSLLIVTWDHDSGTLSDQIPTLFVGPRVKAGNYGENISHYNVLRTVEDMYGLPYLAQDATASPITDVWNTGVPAKLSAATASPPAELATAVAHSAWSDPRLTQWLQSAGSAGGVGSSPISGLPGGQGNVLPPSAPIQGVTGDKHGGPGGHARRPHKQKAKSVAKGKKSAGHRRGKVISPAEWSLRLPT